jgi:HPt (histidine-containing phosphotransfer) domain-containing protein
MLGFNRIIDKKTFHEIIGDDLEHLDTIIALFEEQADDNLTNMREAILKEDRGAFERAAHDLKNMGRNVASNRLVEHSHELEKLAAEARFGALHDKLEESSDLLAKALKELKSLRKKWS